MRPDISFSELSPSSQKSARFLTRNIHGIEWDDGYVSPDDALLLLRDTLRRACMIYCEGSERVAWLKRRLGLYATDLDILECPKKDDWPPDQLQLFLQLSLIHISEPTRPY